VYCSYLNFLGVFMNFISSYAWRFSGFQSLSRFLLPACLFMLLSSVINVAADETEAEPDYAEETAEATEEVNTNDPTAAAISVSAGWEFYSWHDDEIAPGQTRPGGSIHCIVGT
jgi:hypothetical protein